MSMHTPSGGTGDEPEVMMDINTTPLIDVMLVLLIMLIITIPIQMHAVKMNLPVGTPPPAAPPPVVQIDIDAAGAVRWDGTKLDSRRDLERHMANVAARAEQPELHLQPDKLAPYGAVAEVLAAAQREGATKIGVVGDESDAQ
ncbi:biopolymer transporter ExbD [Paraburkholderia xenovorans]|uniref:ExbD/TolR family protein n=1 Tax=Paraburkholderia xenovorans TaxID=36873 RepID=UPI0038BA8163